MDLGHYCTDEMRANDKLWEWVLEQSKWNHLLGKSLDDMLRDYYNPFSKFNDTEEQEMKEYIEKYGLEESYYSDYLPDEDQYLYEEDDNEPDNNYDEDYEVSDETDTDDEEYEYYESY